MKKRRKCNGMTKEVESLLSLSRKKINTPIVTLYGKTLSLSKLSLFHYNALKKHLSSAFTLENIIKLL